jgi:FlaG/FlaF family flagellin (archaellin)
MDKPGTKSEEGCVQEVVDAAEELLEEKISVRVHAADGRKYCKQTRRSTTASKDGEQFPADTRRYTEGSSFFTLSTRVSRMPLPSGRDARDK